MKRYILFRCAFVILSTIFTLGISAQKIHPNKIRIVDFKVMRDQNKVSINWSTDNAWPTNYFEVEKSNDGENFKTVAYVLGADPAKTGCDCYGCFDKIKAGQGYYYRLKHVDLNGEVELSEVKLIALNK